MSSLNQDWDVNKPINHTLIGDIPSNIRGVIEATKTVLSREHSTPYTNNGGVIHVKGSAMAYIDSVTPTLRPCGVDSLLTAVDADSGRLAVVTAESPYALKVYAATPEGISTGWVDLRVAKADLVGTLVAETNIDLAKHTIVALKNDTYITGRNAADDAEVDIIKVNDSDTVVIPVGAELSATIDGDSEDNAIVNKSYVDNNKQVALTVATGTTSIETTSDSYSDMADMSITITGVLTGQKIVYNFNAVVYGQYGRANHASYGTYAQLVIGANSVCVVGASSFTGGIDSVISIHWVHTAEADGDITAKIQWRSGLNSSYSRQNGTKHVRILTGQLVK